MRHWQKYAAIGMTAVLAAGLMTGCGSDKKAEQGASGEKNKIVIGLDDNFPPFGFHDESGELVGFDIDMAKEAAKRLGIEVEFKPIDWGQQRNGIEQQENRCHLEWPVYYTGTGKEYPLFPAV